VLGQVGEPTNHAVTGVLVDVPHRALSQLLRLRKEGEETDGLVCQDGSVGQQSFLGS
jgi:hypothetical protein